MTKFSELTALADECKKITGKSCFVAVEYWSWNHKDDSELLYKLYIDGDRTGTRYFKTAAKLKDAIDFKKSYNIW